MKKVYEIFNTQHSYFRRFLKSPMEAITWQKKIHYEHHKSLYTLETRIEELKHIKQWEEGFLFAIKYTIENIKNAIKYKTLDVYYANKYEISAKSEAAILALEKNQYKDFTEDQYLDLLYYKEGYIRVERSQ